MLDFTTPIDTAYQRMKKILFEPFRFEKWLALGFCAFLASLIQGKYGGWFSWPGNGWSGQDPSHWKQHLSHWNPHAFFHGTEFILILLGVAVAAVLFFVFILLFLWLGCRGRFMFIDNIVHDRAEIQRPWREFRKEGNRLFQFYIVVSLVSLAFVGLLAGLGLIFVFRGFVHQHFHGFTGVLMPLLGLFFFVLIVWIPLCIFFFFFAEFGVPLIYLRRIGPVEAWKEVWRMCLARPLDLFIYLLFRFLIGMLFMIVACMIVCLTCCLSGLPYVGAVVFLPLTVFIQCYTLDILRQFGPDYDLWTLAQPLPPPPLPTPPDEPTPPPTPAPV